MRTHVSLPDELVKDIDELVGKRKRSEFIAATIEEGVRREKLRRIVREGAGSIDLEDYPEWSTRERTQHWLKSLKNIPSSFDKSHGSLPARRKRSH